MKRITIKVRMENEGGVYRFLLDTNGKLIGKVEPDTKTDNYKVSVNGVSFNETEPFIEAWEDVISGIELFFYEFGIDVKFV